MIVKAFVVLREGVAGTDGLVNLLQEHVKREIAPYKYPRAIEFVSELPRTASGKLKRFMLHNIGADASVRDAGRRPAANG